MDWNLVAVLYQENYREMRRGISTRPVLPADRTETTLRITNWGQNILLPLLPKLVFSIYTGKEQCLSPYLLTAYVPFLLLKYATMSL